MNKQIYKGIEVVSAKEIHESLGIKKHFSQWIKYSIDRAMLDEGIDFLTILLESTGGRKVTDYLLTEQSAISVIVMSGGNNSKKLRNHIINLFNKHESGEAFTTDQISALLDLTKAMTLKSVRKESERKHYDFMNQPRDWWEYRSNLLGYSKDSLQKEMAKINKRYKSIEHSLMKLEPSELIRTGTIDLLIALGRPIKYAKNAANLTKRFAIEMGIDKEIWNDIKDNPLRLNKSDIEEKKGLFSGFKKAIGI